MSESIQSQGGTARAAKLSPERRKEIAQQAARKRWQNKPKLMNEPKSMVCPTCGMLLPTAQLVQLNTTLQLLLSDGTEGMHVERIAGLVEKVVCEIERVSKALSSQPLPNLREKFTETKTP